MEHLTDAVRAAVREENWYGALVLALTLPDICGALEQPEERNGPRYMRWCSRFLSPIYTQEIGHPPQRTVFLNANDAWKLRNAIVHDGSAQLRADEVKDVLHRVSFASAGPHRGRVNVNGRDHLVLVVADFCNDMIRAVDEWRETVAENEAVQIRISGLLEIHTSSYTIDGVVRIGVQPNPRQA
ncbi:hypothetical protein [Paraburkholderia acidisoli]|uniref:Uncharacterized protein n=1 Tax=Paraburkholderia acidisoli TaxID=2571748 RepID=A0A7Z2JF73_9BURK|nr:hypothetical protein [Paraburkholderia acidisoli]QGZ61643.1 hypothetical protein FAZ98_07780 [Paraburkholderia acidisoli]